MAAACYGTGQAAASGYTARVSQGSPLNKRDIIVVALVVLLSIVAQSLAAIYGGSTESLLALGGSALAFVIWVLLRFR